MRSRRKLGVRRTEKRSGTRLARPTGGGSLLQVLLEGHGLSGAVLSGRDSQALSELRVQRLEHVVQIAGFDHVGIGSDFDGITAVPKGLEDISRMPALKAALRKKGYSDAQIRKIFGGNTLRVLRDVVGR